MGIKTFLLDSITTIIPRFIKRRIIINSEQSGIQIYSQEGEDKLIERLLGTKNYGIYVDVGAHHPTILSNTYFFYRKGWRGINIDAMPGSMKRFNEIRPYDINIEKPVSDDNTACTFYTFSAPELNTFDETKVHTFLNFPNVTLLNKIVMQPTSLESILDTHLSKLGTNAQIDFLTVDVEGFDLKVLKSNNWNKYRPTIVLAEDLFFDVIGSYNGELNYFMKSVGYRMIAKTFNTVFFQKNETGFDHNASV